MHAAARVRQRTRVLFAGLREPAGLTVLLTLLVAATGAVLLQRAGSAPLLAAPDGALLVLAAVALAATFFVAELGQALVEVRRQAYSFSLSGVPLLLGLLYLPPTWLLVTRLLAALCAFLVQRASPIKAAFNTASYLLDTALVLALTSWLLPGPTALTLRTAALCYLSLAVVDLLMSLLVLLVIRLHQGPLTAAEVTEVLAPAAGFVLLNSAFALIGALLLTGGALGTVLLALFVVVTAGVYRGFLVLRARHQSLQVVQEFIRHGEGAGSVEELAEGLLARLRILLRASRVELTLLDDRGALTLHVRAEEAGAAVGRGSGSRAGHAPVQSARGRRPAAARSPAVRRGGGVAACTRRARRPRRPAVALRSARRRRRPGPDRRGHRLHPERPGTSPDPRRPPRRRPAQPSPDAATPAGGDPRLAHRTAQPGPPAGPPAGRARRRVHRAAGGAAARPGPVQGGQRRPRPPRRRRTAAGRRGAGARSGPGRLHRGPSGRRRVRGPAARQHEARGAVPDAGRRGGRRRRRRADPPGARRPRRAAGRRLQHRREHRRRRGWARADAHRRAAARRHGDVRRQGRRVPRSWCSRPSSTWGGGERLALLADLHLALERGRAGAALPAQARSRLGHRDRRRGPGALAAPCPRPAQPGRVRAAGRVDRSHRAAHRDGARSRLAPGAAPGRTAAST